MLPEALTALAAAGGSAVVQAAGTDVWTGIRERLAAWFGRGDTERERTERERLDRTASVLAAAETEQAAVVRAREEAVWQTRIEVVLESLAEDERALAAAALRAVIDGGGPRGIGLAVVERGLAAGGDVIVTAEDGSVAAGVVQGDVHMGNPPQPDPAQG